MQYFKNIVFLLVLFNSFQAFSESIYNITPIEVSKNVYVFFGDVNNLNNVNGGAISNTGFIRGKKYISNRCWPKLFVCFNSYRNY